MAADFCLTSRTFYRFRAVLMQSLGLSRHQVRPRMRLDELIPAEKRQAVWRALRREGLALPGLVLSVRVAWSNFLHALHVAGGLGLWFQNWCAFFAIYSLGLVLLRCITRPLAVFVDPYGPITVQDAVIYLTPLDKCRALGYRLSHREIETRVRLILARALNVPMERITPESRLEADLGAA